MTEIAIRRTNDAAELLAIHKQLFGNVYDWAGQIRTVDIRKNADGAEYFLIVAKIPTALDFVFNELANENQLRGLDKKQFIARLAYFYDQLNYIHPFREGNGRAQRVFWSRVAHDAGYSIDWNKVVGDENDRASRLAAETLDLSALEKMFGEIIIEKHR
jgi:cell filamentation protein